MSPGRGCVAEGSGQLIQGQVVSQLTADPGAREPRGWIMFRSQGNSFFAPFRQQDVVDDLPLALGDHVEFRRAASGPCATEVRLVGRAITCLGIVSCVRLGPASQSQRQELGLIERADATREVMFQASGALKGLRVGDEVGFTVKGRPGREQAVGVTRLEPSTVRIEDVSVRRVKGRVVQPLRREQSQTFVAGKIRYLSSHEWHTEVEYGPRGQARPHTLLTGDTVWFSLAVDRRTQHHCAVNIELCPESLQQSGERRERGTILLIKDDYGVVRATASHHTLFFSIDELLDLDKKAQVNDEVEYTRQECGLEQGTYAARVLLLSAPVVPPTQCGHVAAMLESLGFIEPLSLDHDVLFSPRQLDGDPARLQLGAPVQYVAASRGSTRNLLAAKMVRLLPPGSVELPPVLAGLRRGTVLRPLRYFDPHQVSYAGIIAECGEDGAENGRQFKFGVYSLQNIEDVLLPGMGVKFQVNTDGHAVNVMPDTACLRGQVMFARSWYGYVQSDQVPSKLVYFLRSEVHDSSDLLPGDTVEFRLVCNPRSCRFSAREVYRCNDNLTCSADSKKNLSQHHDHTSCNSTVQTEGSVKAFLGSEYESYDEKSQNCKLTSADADVYNEGTHARLEVFDFNKQECLNNTSKLSSSYGSDNIQDSTKSEKEFELSTKHLDNAESNTTTLKNAASSQDAKPALHSDTNVDGDCPGNAEDKDNAKINGTCNGPEKYKPHVDAVQKTMLKKADGKAGHSGRRSRKIGSCRVSYKAVVETQDNMATRVVVIRQPRGPDGSTGFGTRKLSQFNHVNKNYSWYLK